MSVPHLCSHCYKAATATCSGCGDANDSATEERDLTWYCGAACQKADWEKHRAACEAAQSRRVLYRTSEIAQHLLYILLKNCYMSLIVKAERQEDSWVIWKGQHPGKSIVVPFPEEIFPNVEARKAILFSHCCNAAVAHLHDLFKEMLEGICSKIDEVTVEVKNTAFTIKTVSNENEMDDSVPYHNVLKVTLNTNEVYALDVTGAQFGWREPMMDWNTFYDSRVQWIKEECAFGAEVQIVKAQAEAAKSLHAMMDQILAEMAKRLYQFLDEWQQSNMVLVDVVRLPEELYCQKRSLLFGFMEQSMVALNAFAQVEGFFDILKVES